MREHMHFISFMRHSNSIRRPPPICTVVIAGTMIKALIDTGASLNVIDQTTWKRLAERPSIKKTLTRIFTYGGTTPLPGLGVIDVPVTYGEKQVLTTFHVTKGSTGILLRCNMSEDLGLVSSVRQVHESHADAILRDFPQFDGLGKLKGKQIRLHIEKTVKATALRHRQVPFHSRPKVDPRWRKN